MNQGKSQSTPPSVRTIWIDLLLYPGHTLPTAAAPVLVAAGLAFHNNLLALVPTFVGFLASWFIHVGGVFNDNYYLVTRHSRVREHPELNEAMENGTLTRFGLKAAIAICFILAACTGPYLLEVGGWPVVVIGLVGAAASLVYVAGPSPATRHGLADPLFFVMFGIVAEVGIYYIQAAAHASGSDWLTVIRALPPTVFVVGLPVGALVTNVMIIDDIRDHEFDRVKGWRTGTVLFGLKWSRIEFISLSILAYVAPIWFWVGMGFKAWVLLPLLTLPIAYGIARAVCTLERREDLFPMTPRAAMLSLIYSALLSIGIAIS